MKCAPGSGSGSVRVTSGIIKQGKSFKNWSMVEPEVEWIWNLMVFVKTYPSSSRWCLLRWELRTNGFFFCSEAARWNKLQYCSPWKHVLQTLQRLGKHSNFLFLVFNGFIPQILVSQMSHSRLHLVFTPQMVQSCLGDVNSPGKSKLN